MDLDITIRSTKPEQTESIGRSLGSKLRGGEIIELASDLGGGKTTLVRGIVAGLGSKDAVSSPSFTISKVYTSSLVSVHHYDFYRLMEPGLMAEELNEVMNDEHNVTIVEWAEIVENILPNNRIAIRITATSEHERSLHIEYSDTFAYLFEELA